jgi:hypothetical protein
MKDLTNCRFGRLIVIDLSPNLDPVAIWRCRCDCGKEKLVKHLNLKSGRTKSCGCLKRDTTISRRTTHGQSKNRKSSQEYNSWNAMKRRCLNPNSQKYQSYGGRGIAICVSWSQSFNAFFRDMGRKPSSKHTLGRLDNDGNYEPGNCAWQTPHEQARNMRQNVFVESNGENLILTDACKKFGIKYSAVQARRARGWSLERALKTPLLVKIKKQTVTVSGRSMSLVEACNASNIAYAVAWGRLRKGWSDERALTEPVRATKHI